MAVFNDSLNITPAAGITSRIRLDETHLTTLDFGQIMPFYIREMLPRDSYNISYNFFSRNTPLNFPAYIDGNLVAVGVYVPCYQIFEGADAYFQGFPQVSGHALLLPYITAYALDLMFTTKANGLLENCPSASAQVFISVDSSAPSFIPIGTLSGPCRFTYKGRLFYKILRGLGYQLSSGINYNSVTDNDGYTKLAREKRLNALPFLSFVKAYHDWFASSFTYYSDQLGSLLSKYKSKVYTLPNAAMDYNNYGISSSDLYTMLNSVRLMYKNDYFTNAWRYTNAPLPQQDVTFSVPTSSGAGRSVVSHNSDTQTGVYHPNGSFGMLTAMQVRSLNVLDNYIRRNNYAGTKAAIRALARFGIKTEDFKSNYADIVDIKRIPLNIGDVTQTSETNTSPLGSFGGKGIISGDSSVTINSSDYGYFMVIGFLQLDVIYPQGYSHEVLKTDVFDFYNPEFDGLGMQPISYDELVSDPSLAPSGNNTYSKGSKVFGFTERYNDYRTSRDKITGDFLLFGELYSWHAGRQLMPFRLSGVSAQSDSMIYYPNDKQTEFDRIFATTDSEQNDNTPDHFYITSYFRNDATRPIKNSNEVANLGVGNINIQKNGTHVE